MDKKKLMKIVVLIAVLCIPIMYSFFYLKSYWDPYGNLKEMKIAMVNLDEGENEENQGQKLVDALIEKDVMTICQVSEEEAKNGLINEEYFAIITIPTNFTNYLNSASTTDKKVATITYSPNQKMNYLASQIVNKVVSSTELELQAQVSEKVVENLAEKLKSVPENLEKINNGTDKILNGTNELSNGLGKINNGVTSLNNSYDEFDKGINSAYIGSQKLNEGISQINSGASQLSSGNEKLALAIEQISKGSENLSNNANLGIDQLAGGIEKIKTGSSDLESGANLLNTSINDYVTGVNQLNENVLPLLQGFVNYCNANPKILDDASLKNLYNGANQILKTGAINSLTTNGEKLKTGANKLNIGTNQLNQGITELANNTTKLNMLSNGVTTLNSSLAQLQEGSKNLKTGFANLTTGTNQLKTGSYELTTGLEKLNNSSGQVKNGLNELQNASKSAYLGSLNLINGLQTFKTETNDGLVKANEELNKLDGLSEFVKNPVEVKEVDYGQVSTYGIAFTPLFISVALWVGSLMAYVVLYYDQEKRFKLLDKYAQNKFIQSALYLGIAVLQGIITAFLLKIGLGINIENNLLYYGTTILISITFMSIIQFLIINFGEAGKFIALLLLVLQLASSGGTFPVQIIDKAFQKISPYMPMTYTIKLLKEALILEMPGKVANNVKILCLISLICILTTFLIESLKKVIIKKKNTEKK